MFADYFRSWSQNANIIPLPSLFQCNGIQRPTVYSCAKANRLWRHGHCKLCQGRLPIDPASFALRANPYHVFSSLSRLMCTIISPPHNKPKPQRNWIQWVLFQIMYIESDLYFVLYLQSSEQSFVRFPNKILK